MAYSFRSDHHRSASDADGALIEAADLEDFWFPFGMVLEHVRADDFERRLRAALNAAGLRVGDHDALLATSRRAFRRAR
jgi:hypothetical protein